MIKTTVKIEEKKENMKRTKAQASAKHKTKLERRFILTLMILLSVLLGSVIATQLINPLFASTKESIESTRISLRLKTSKTGKRVIVHSVDLPGQSSIHQVAYYQVLGVANKQQGYRMIDCTAVPSKRYTPSKSKRSPINVHPKAQQVCLRVTYRTQFPSHRRALEKLPYYERQSFARMVVTDPSQLRANSPTTSFPHQPELILEQESQSRFRYNVIAAKDQIVKLGYYEQSSQSVAKESSSYNTKGCPKSNSQYKEVVDWNPSSKSQAEALAGSIQIESVSPDFVCLLLVYNRYNQKEDVYYLRHEMHQILQWKTADQLQESLPGDYRRMRLNSLRPEYPTIETIHIGTPSAIMLVECPIDDIYSDECQELLADLSTFCYSANNIRPLSLPRCLDQGFGFYGDEQDYQEHVELLRQSGWIKSDDNQSQIVYPLQNLQAIVCDTLLLYSASLQARDCSMLQNSQPSLFVSAKETTERGRLAMQVADWVDYGYGPLPVTIRRVVEIDSFTNTRRQRLLVSSDIGSRQHCLDAQNQEGCLSVIQMLAQYCGFSIAGYQDHHKESQFASCLADAKASELKDWMQKLALRRPDAQHHTVIDCSNARLIGLFVGEWCQSEKTQLADSVTVIEYWPIQE